MTEKKRLVVIPGSLNEHTLAHDLVSRGNVDRAVVMSADKPNGAWGHISFEAWRIGPTSYAWRTPTMGAPAFGPIVVDEREPVHGMPRWEWDLYGMVVKG